MEEAKDLNTMKVEELMGSIQTFELNRQMRQKENPTKVKEKEKSIALKGFEKKNRQLVCLNNTVSVNKVTDNTTCTVDVVDTDFDESEANEDSLEESYKKWFQSKGKIVFVQARSLPIVSSDLTLQVSDPSTSLNVSSAKRQIDTFCDGVAGKVIGKGTLNFEGVIDKDGNCVLKVLDHLTIVLFKDYPKWVNSLLVEILNGKKYNFVCVDDFSRFTWVDFLRGKSDTFEAFKTLCLKLRVEKDYNIGKIVRYRRDHGKEVENTAFDEFYKSCGISHEFSAPKTPGQNGVVERENHTLQEMARVMLNSKKLSKRLWDGAINNACYKINSVFTSSRAYRVYNMRKQTVMESANIVVDDVKDFSEFSTEVEMEKFMENTPTTSDAQYDVSETLPVVTETSIKLSSMASDTSPSEQAEAQMSRIINDSIHREPSKRLLLVVACIMGFKLHQVDVKSSFLNGVLNKEAFNEQPKRFEDPRFPNHVFKLIKVVYGLKQAPWAWYERSTQFLVSHSYRRCGVDKTLVIKNIKKDVIIAQIYVDDIVFGLQAKQSEDGMFISQSKYAKNLLKMFGLDTAKHTKTLMGTPVKLTKDDNEVKLDPTLYRCMIGSLLYLTASRLDICYSVGVCASYQGNPMESHVTALKRSIRYVHNTLEYGISYSKETNSNLVCFSDVNWAGNADDRKSTSGGCFYLGDNLVSWHSKKQNFISLSIVEAEYIASGSCCTQLLWMKQMMSGYGFELDTLTISCDNTSAINISKNLIQHSRTKHIDIRHNFIRELVENKTLILEYIETDKQIADIFTRSLDSIRNPWHEHDVSGSASSALNGSASSALPPVASGSTSKSSLKTRTCK
ncbi:uncharacterized protein LOC133799460 [Humulus lupulus]|uniref:uncharacterized protein LOC133799460 n=1 Tax=Humulus lupulus TaxID=3486 RepID=UPI002B400636|nr:uncharacterized protein LOC133799460 [Humulus lupulus]